MNLIDILKMETAEWLWKLPQNTAVRAELDSYRELLRLDGCCVLKDFMDKSLVDQLLVQARNTFNNHSEFVVIESNGTDKRIYGVERLCKDFALADKLQLTDQLADQFYMHGSGKWFQLLGNISYREGNLGSGSGWHRDSPFSHQFKAILYLTDVHSENGPFEYIKGSHLKQSIKSASRFLGKEMREYRFSDDEITRLEEAHVVSRRMAITAPRGSLLLADTRGLHRGRPLTSGERYALTRYYFRRQVPKQFTSRYPLTDESRSTIQ
jgi:hypothetical protein